MLYAAWSPARAFVAQRLTGSAPVLRAILDSSRWLPAGQLGLCMSIFPSSVEGYVQIWVLLPKHLQLQATTGQMRQQWTTSLFLKIH